MYYLIWTIQTIVQMKIKINNNTYYLFQIHPEDYIKFNNLEGRVQAFYPGYKLLGKLSELDNKELKEKLEKELDYFVLTK